MRKYFLGILFYFSCVDSFAAKGSVIRPLEYQGFADSPFQGVRTMREKSLLFVSSKVYSANRFVPQQATLERYKSWIWSLVLWIILNASVFGAVIFDVTSFTPGYGASALGTSNGIAFTLTSGYINEGYSVTNGTFTGFSSSLQHNPSLAFSDVLHLGSESVIMNFESKISSAIIYMRDNPSYPDSELDFGIIPFVLSGDIGIDGTKFRPLTINGGVVRLDGIDSNTLIHTKIPGVIGGLDFAIVVIPAVDPVPEPSTLIIGSCIGMLGLARRLSIPGITVLKMNGSYRRKGRRDRDRIGTD